MELLTLFKGEGTADLTKKTQVNKWRAFCSQDVKFYAARIWRTVE
jgi:hypothetical protein